MKYPTEITFKPGTEKYNYFYKHSDLFRSLADEYGTVEFTQDTFLGGDKRKWRIFYDLFFPEEDVAPLFVDWHFDTYVIPQVVLGREGLSGQQIYDDIMDIFEYLMMDRVSYQRPRLNLQGNPILNKSGKPKMTNSTNIEATQQKMAETLLELANRRRNIQYNNNNNNTFKNKIPIEQPKKQVITNNEFLNNYANNNNNNNGVNIGFTQEEEEAMESVDPKYHKYFKKGGRKTRRGRKGRKNCTKRR